MISKLNILQIRKDAIYAIKENVNYLSFFIVYYMFPILCAILVHFSGYELNAGLFGNLISGISLFAALLFSLIFVVTNNFSNRKVQHQSTDEEVVRYLKNYKKFSNNIVALISYTIIKSILIIILLIFSDAYIDYLDNKSNLFIMIIWDIIILLLIQFLIYIVVILKEMYVMQYEDINRE